MIVDLRSDTVTKPTHGMLEAMMNAQVGDDVFNEDPTIKALEEKCAAIFGMDEGLFCPSGTMTNQIAVNILTQPYDEIICYSGAHIYKYEGGGAPGNSGVSFKLLDGNRGILNAEEILSGINPDDVHFPTTSVVGLENTVNKGGGCFYTMDQIAVIASACKENGLSLHLDGARVFNALAESNEDPSLYGQYFDTISVCLSKGLGAPVGSVLLFKNSLSRKARRMRKVFGGGMRQAGYLAAAGIYALDNHVERLAEDHSRARVLGKAINDLEFVNSVLPVDTNIVIFELSEGLTSNAFIEALDSYNVKAVPFGPKEVRFVTHLEIDDDQLNSTIDLLKSSEFKDHLLLTK
ncbi:MAG: GntG family PLP-dependent aldolase [Bacteroidota bacterium]